MTHSGKGDLVLKRIEPGKEDPVIDYLSRIFKNASKEKIERLIRKTPALLVKDVAEAKVSSIISALGKLGAESEFRANTVETAPSQSQGGRPSSRPDTPEPEPEHVRTPPAESDVAPCSQCGRSHSREEMLQYNDLWVCAACKSTFVQKLKEGEFVGSQLVFGGFWIRAGAKIIDGIVISVMGWVLGFILNVTIGAAGFSDSQEIATMISGVLNLVLAAAYTTWFLGRFAATPGKMACGLTVVMPDGGKVSYFRALGRHFAEWISSMILGIGYLMAAFDDEKRTLHDRICSTRVAKKQ